MVIITYVAQNKCSEFPCSTPHISQLTKSYQNLTMPTTVKAKYDDQHREKNTICLLLDGHMPSAGHLPTWGFLPPTNDPVQTYARSEKSKGFVCVFPINMDRTYQRSLRHCSIIWNKRSIPATTSENRNMTRDEIATLQYRLLSLDHSVQWCFWFLHWYEYLLRNLRIKGC